MFFGIGQLCVLQWTLCQYGTYRNLELGLGIHGLYTLIGFWANVQLTHKPNIFNTTDTQFHILLSCQLIMEATSLSHAWFHQPFWSLVHASLNKENKEDNLIRRHMMLCLYLNKHSTSLTISCLWPNCLITLDQVNPLWVHNSQKYSIDPTPCNMLLTIPKFK